MQEELKPYKYVTSEDSQNTYIYVNNDGQYRKKYVFLPSMFETMNHKYKKIINILRQIQAYKYKINIRFMTWTLFNRDKFKNNIDYRIVLSRFIDINTAVLASLTVTYMLRTFLFKLESPFLDFYFDDKPIKLPQIKRFIAYSVGAMILYKSVKSVLSLDYLYDIALEYREHFARELISENCESQLKSIKNN